MTDPTPSPSEINAIRERVVLPGAFLIVIGCLNLLLGLMVAHTGLSIMSLSDEDMRDSLRQAWEKQSPETREKLTAQNLGPEEMQEIFRALGQIFRWAVVSA